MTINFPTHAEPEDAHQPPSRDTPTKHAGEQGLLFGEDLAVQRKHVGYSPPSACTAAGITARVLDYWARTGLVQPSLSAASSPESPPLYSFRDIFMLKVTKRLLDTGISLQQIRSVAHHLRHQGSDYLAGLTLMSDGVSVYECSTPDEVMDLLETGQATFGISLGRIRQEINEALAELPEETSTRPDLREVLPSGVLRGVEALGEDMRRAKDQNARDAG